MSLEYLPGIEAGQKIDLSQFDKLKKGPKFEKYLPFLKEELFKLSLEANTELANFLDKDCRICLEGEEAESDLSLIAAQEDSFSREVGKNLDTWRRDTEKNPTNLTEIALTVMLAKFLKDDFIVARASSYDDYNYGVDSVLIYKKTGEVVCGFDEVIGNQGDDGGEKKDAKMEKIMSKGGAQLKYGAKMLDGQLVRSEVKNIPAFYMSLSKVELGELLDSLKNNPDITGAPEQKIFTKLINSLEEQATKQHLNKNLQIKTELALTRLRTCLNTEKLAA